MPSVSCASHTFYPWSLRGRQTIYNIQKDLRCSRCHRTSLYSRCALPRAPSFAPLRASRSPPAAGAHAPLRMMRRRRVRIGIDRRRKRHHLWLRLRLRMRGRLNGLRGRAGLHRARCEIWHADAQCTRRTRRLVHEGRFLEVLHFNARAVCAGSGAGSGLAAEIVVGEYIGPLGGCAAGKPEQRVSTAQNCRV